MKNKEHKSSDCSICESHEKEAYFLRKLKKGSTKYKGKFPFKCFNCGKLGYFFVESPYVKNESIDDEEYHNIKKSRKRHQNKNNGR